MVSMATVLMDATITNANYHALATDFYQIYDCLVLRFVLQKLNGHLVIVFTV